MGKSDIKVLMDCRIVYIHHSSFLLVFSDRVFLFDFPSKKHADPLSYQVLEQYIPGSNLFVFFSHSHEDHFCPEIVDITKRAASVQFIASDDIPDMFPGVLPESALIVEPDENYELEGMTIQTYMSNDLGVAFLLSLGRLVVYYGGDLAKWDWDNLTPPAKKSVEKYYSGILERLGKKTIHIAFSNVDSRLKSLAGGVEFVEKVTPMVFVPMHTFGKTEVINELQKRLQGTDSVIFSYQRPGDGLKPPFENI